MAGGFTCKCSAESTVWVRWTTGTCCDNNATDTCETWYTWNDSTYTTSATATKVWVKWINNSERQCVATQGQAPRQPSSVPTGRSSASARPTSVAWPSTIAAWKEERKKLDAAERRARKLLVAHLSDEQRRELEEHKHFHVVTAEGERFRIDTAQRMHNVHRVDESGKRLEEFCIYQSGETPMSDNHLAQKLLLEADPARFKKIANRRAMA